MNPSESGVAVRLLSVAAVTAGVLWVQRNSAGSLTEEGSTLGKTTGSNYGTFCHSWVKGPFLIHLQQHGRDIYKG